MKKWNWNTALLISGLTAVLCIARTGVSLGRLLYSIRTQTPLAGSAALPQWYQLLLEDPFFFVGIGALIFAVVSFILCKKQNRKA